jgi:hypothetical protein
MHPDRPDLPLEELRAAAAGHPESTSAIDDLHAELSAPTPDPARLQAHAERISAFADLAGPFERWWLNPRVQAFIAELTATGI